MIRVFHSRAVGRLVAITLFLAISGSSSEAIAGQVRDGAVHHESAAAAAQHCDGTQAHGNHGHEDTSAPGTQQHLHGTGADHSTHVHGQWLVTSFTLAVSVDVQEIGFGDVSFTPCAPTRPIKHPPRA